MGGPNRREGRCTGERNFERRAFSNRWQVSVFQSEASGSFLSGLQRLQETKTTSHKLIPNKMEQEKCGTVGHLTIAFAEPASAASSPCPPPPQTAPSVQLEGKRVCG